MRRRLSLFCAPLLALTVGGSAGSASAALPFFPDEPLTPLSSPGVVSYYQPGAVVSVNRRGEAVAAWTIDQERRKYLPTKSEVQVAFRRDPNGPWTAPRTLSAPDSAVSAPHVGISEQGTSTIVWSEWPSSFSPRAKVRITTQGSDFVGTFDLAAEHESLTDATLAFAPSGQSLVAYRSERAEGSTQSAKSQIMAVLLGRQTGSAGPQTLSSSEVDAEASSPTASINASGAAAVAWQQGIGTDGRRIGLAQAGTSGGFGAAVDVTAFDPATQPEARVWDPSVVVDGAGAATVAWNERAASAPVSPYDAVARRVVAGDVAGPRQVLLAGSADPTRPRDPSPVSLGVDDLGQVTAAWSAAADDQYGTVARTVHVATAPPSSSFGPSEQISSWGAAGTPTVAVDPSGTTAVAWGGAQSPPSVFWRPAGAATFSRLRQPTAGWVSHVGGSFGRPDELTLVFDYDLAPLWVVKTATSILKSEAVAPSPPVADTTKPVVTIRGVAVVRPAGKKGKKKKPGRLTATFTASEPVTVRVVVTQKLKGIKKAGKCVKRPSNSKQRKGKKSCTRTVVVGPEVIAPVSPAGSTLDLGKAPAAGSYTLTVKGADAAGNVGAPVATAFKVG